MAQIALPRHRVTQSHSAGVGSPLYQRRHQSNAGPIELIPNPEFSFPMCGPDTTSSEPTPSSSRPMSLQTYPAARRGSTPHMRQRSVNALPLPDFTFNPAGTLKPKTGNSPPVSPVTATTPTTPRPIQGHHRRGGSEFIGGDARPGMSLMSSSPTKGEGDLPAPNAMLRPGPPAGRRGHAHRRSGAVSSHDLSTIMTPPAAKAGSAPAVPSEGQERNSFQFGGHSVNKSVSQPSLRSNDSNVDLDARPPSRARVGFSDHVEYIRPLSSISSETETSSSMRGHSASNSLSSIVSGTNANSQPARLGRPTLSTVEDERPSTAGAVLDKFMSNSLSDEVLERKRPMSAVPSSISPAAVSNQSVPFSTKRRSFFSRNSDKSIHALPISKSDPMLSSYRESPSSSLAVDIKESVESPEKSKTASRKSRPKPRKVKSWANSIIPRKGKHSKKTKARAATPPVARAVEVELDDSDVSEDLDFEPNFDDDTTVTIVSQNDSTAPARKHDADIASWQPRPFKRVDSETMSPIIDLDAALGPFNTPNGSSPRKQQRGFSAHRRAMHSSNGTAPSHRRTESAPELVPFEFRASAAATAAPMADVFEEEEPEEDVVVTKKSSTSSITEEPEEPKIQIVEADGKQEGGAINWNFNDGLCIQRNPRVRQLHETEPLSPREIPQVVPEDAVLRQSGTVEVVEDYEEPRTSSLTHSSDSTITPRPTADEMKEHEPVMSVSVPLSQQSLMTPNTVTSSYLPSPDYQSSRVSFETPQFDTAASSVNEYPIMPSPRYGEPGPELRNSVDDVPSLTSSRSTMTIAMQNGCPLPSPRRPSDRSASLCSAPSDGESRRRKRSSIVSLSRLINGSSFNERSKLSIEQRPHTQHMMEPVKEKKKSNRLSRLMFWKSRGSSLSSRSQV